MAEEKLGQLKKRYCVSFSRDQAELLEEFAKRNGVSVSWLVRLAVDDFTGRQGDRQLRLRFEARDSD